MSNREADRESERVSVCVCFSFRGNLRQSRHRVCKTVSVCTLASQLVPVCVFAHINYASVHEYMFVLCESICVRV